MLSNTPPSPMNCLWASSQSFADLGDREQLHLRERRGVLLQHACVARPVEVLGDDLLRLVACRGTAGTPRRGARLLAVDVLVDDGDVRLGADADRRIDEVQLAASPPAPRGALRSPRRGGRRRSSSARRSSSRRARRNRAPAPACRAWSRSPRLGVAAAAARTTEPQARRRLSWPLPDVFGFGVMISTPGLTRSGQSLIPLGLPLRTTNTIVDV